MKTVKIRRSLDLGLYGWLTVLGILALGFCAFMGTVAYSIMGGMGSLIRLDVPGEHQVMLPAAGNYVVYHEYPRSPDKLGIRRPPGAEALQLRLTNEAGAAVPLASAEGESRYTLRLAAGESWYRFAIPGGGSHRISAFYPEGQPGPATLVTLKRDHAELLLSALIRGVLILLATAAGSVAAGVVFYRIRARSHPVDIEFRT